LRLVGDVSITLAGKLKAGCPAVGDNVVDLAGNLLLGKRGEERESLEHLVVERRPHHHVGGLWCIADLSSDLDGLGETLEGLGCNGGNRNLGGHCASHFERS